MNQHLYTLEPYKGLNTRYRCPSCRQRNNTFSLYIDTETGKHLHPSVGRCNRETNCGYHYTPKQYFQENNISDSAVQPKGYTKLKTITPQKKLISFIPVEILKTSLKSYEANNFVKFLNDLFGIEITNELVSRYFIATSKYWNGATVFWQIDILGKVRTGKIMLYSPTTGKRIKEPFNHITWVHKAIKQPEFVLRQCFFGEHLIQDRTKPIAIVESEKTAVIASIYLPQFVWLAAGSLTNLNAEKCSILKGRTVTLFPDLNGLKKWNSKAKKLSSLAIFTVSDLLERKATEAERKQGFDLADYLIKFDYREFIIPEPTKQPPTIHPIIEVNKIEPIEPEHSFGKAGKTKPENWTQDITELEQFFYAVTLPTPPIILDKCSQITDVSLFVNSNMSIIKAQNGNKRYEPYLNRLRNFKKYIKTNMN